MKQIETYQKIVPSEDAGRLNDAQLEAVHTTEGSFA